MKKRFSKSKDGIPLLQGELYIHIYEAKDLPDMDGKYSFTNPKYYKNIIFIVHVKGWVAKLYDKEDVTDAYVEVRLGKGHLARTSVIQDDLNPKFYEDFRVKVCHFANELTFEVRDEDHLSSEFIGNVEIPSEKLLQGNAIEGWFDIKGKNGQSHGQLKLKVVYL